MNCNPSTEWVMNWIALSWTWISISTTFSNITSMMPMDWITSQSRLSDVEKFGVTDVPIFETISRIILAPNDLLTPFDLRVQTFRVNVELSGKLIPTSRITLTMSGNHMSSMHISIDALHIFKVPAPVVVSVGRTRIKLFSSFSILTRIWRHFTIKSDISAQQTNFSSLINDSWKSLYKLQLF